MVHAEQVITDLVERILDEQCHPRTLDNGDVGATKAIQEWLGAGGFEPLPV